ncbi:MAG TPA: glycosyltransferase family 1 protein [Xanthobacteraceae bacterium]|jgi:glycosyltransferase involved in cell wall biosynthesis|nr:glycosyltransferase family 1 protein [Xanthobacteraceae bacterium]
MATASLLALFNRHIPTVGRSRGAEIASLGDMPTVPSVALSRQPVVWFEVEDFLRYFDHFRNPTGLQRVPFEIYLEAERLYGNSGRIRFCRLSAYSKQLNPIGFEAISTQYLNPPGAAAPWHSIWAPARLFEELRSALPMIVRHPRFFFSLFLDAARDLIGKRWHRHRFERLIQPGDIIVSLGAAWGVPHYMKHMAEAKRRYGIRFAILIHDLIPIEYETLVERRHVVQFRNWLEEALPVADVVLTASKHSRNALTKLAAAAGWLLPRVEVLEPGSGLNDRLTSGSAATLNLPQRYVLFVSTIEVRKNHRLLVNVWRQLVERHGADAVPALVFVGQIGWLVDDLLEELKDCEYLGGKIVLLAKLSDAELRQAYRSSLFTVFPSWCEGWGLPIAESLMHGKFCVASNRTSIPEVGGDLIDYFDPSDEADALAKIERLMLDPGYLSAREARLRAEYRPRSWADCVHALIGKLDPTVPAEV